MNLIVLETEMEVKMCVKRETKWILLYSCLV